MLARQSAIVIEKAITTSNAVAYDAADQIGTTLYIPKVMLDSKACALLKSITIIDKSKQKASIDILFFDDEPTNAVADNSAADISDAEMIDKCLGYVNVPAASYVDLSASSIATVKAVDFVLKTNADSSKGIWLVLVTRGTPTYTSTSDLMLKLGIQQY